ncbi:hypothetical protein, partial [Salmonella enterica]|uniref:hypothetical protein n=1 Tax=Salmonella enterica TaxID=28901 RepID=UPI003F4C1A80
LEFAFDEIELEADEERSEFAPDGDEIVRGFRGPDLQQHVAAGQAFAADQRNEFRDVQGDAGAKRQIPLFVEV